MPDRWRCCQCDNNWMTVKEGANICTMSDCRHSKCRTCEVKWFSVAITPPILDNSGKHIFDVHANDWIPHFRTYGNGCGHTDHDHVDGE